MSDPVHALVLDLLEWLATGARPYHEVMEVWRTSCPRLPVWETANELGFIEHHHTPGAAATVSLSTCGLAYLTQHRTSAAHTRDGASLSTMHS
jgi:D-3-phosphoglycerate dehydrogenase